MLKSAIEYLNTIIDATDYVGTTYGLVVLVKKKDSTQNESFPAEYCGNSNYNEVTNFDQSNGSTYWRLRSEIQQTNVNSVSVSKHLTERTYPLRLVCVVKRSALSESNDNAYTEEKLSLSIQKELIGREKNLRSVMKADKVSVVFKGVNSDYSSIASTEFVNIDTNQGSSFILMSIDIDLIAEVRSVCIDDFCDTDLDVDAYIRNEVIVEITNDTSLVTEAQETLITDAFCSAAINIDLNGTRVVTGATSDQDIPVKYVNGDTVGSWTGTIFQIPDPIDQEVNTTFDFVAGSHTLPYTRTAADRDAGSYSSFTLTNFSSLVFKVNGSTFTYTGTDFDAPIPMIEVGDTISVDGTITDTGQDAVVLITGTYT